MNCKVCGNTSAKSTSVSFFRFPKENEKCRDWAERCDLLSLYEKHGTLTFYKSFRICSAHFDSKDIVFDGRKKRLLQSASPIVIGTKSPKQKPNDMTNLGQDEMLNLKVAENLCRLCAKEDRNLTDIYGWQGRILNLEGKLKYFPLMINRYDVLPLRVCHPCIIKVNQFHDFITHCLKAETQLRIMLDLEVCDTSCRSAESNADLQEEVTQDLQLKTPNLDLQPTSSSLPELIAHYPDNIEDDYYNQILQNKDINEDNGNCLCKRTNIVMQSKNHSKPSSAETIQLTNHTNYVKEVDFSNTINFEHDYSNTVSRDQSELESKIQVVSFSCCSAQLLVQQILFRKQEFNSALDLLPLMYMENEQNYTERDISPCHICSESFHSSQLSDSNCSANSAQPALSTELMCEACNKVFISRIEFDLHTSNHTERKYACKICDKKFHKVAFLEEHPFLHPSENSCDGIPDLRPSQIYLESGDKMHEKSFRNRRSHVSEKTGLKSRKRRCQFCDRPFKNRQVCLAHERSHTGETPYQCKQCGKRFRSRPSLRQHGSVHSDKRLHNCQECGMSFKRKDTLSNHFRIHTGERPFVCKVCGFAFKQRGDCTKHEKNHQKSSSRADVKEEKFRQKSQMCDTATVTSGPLWHPQSGIGTETEKPAETKVKRFREQKERREWKGSTSRGDWKRKKWKFQVSGIVHCFWFFQYPPPVEGFVKMDLLQPLDGLSWNDGENSSLPYTLAAMEIAPLDPFDDAVAGQIVSFNF